MQTQIAPLAIPDCLALHLKPVAAALVVARYVLRRPAADEWQVPAPLSAIAAAHRLSRERVRQILRDALAQLRQEPARACLQVFLEPARHWLQQQGGAATLLDIRARDDTKPLFAESPGPCAFIFLSDLFPEALVRRHLFYTVLPEAGLCRLEQQGQAALAHGAMFQDSQTLLAALQGAADGLTGKVLELLLASLMPVGRTAEGQWFLYARGAPKMLRHSLEQAGRPLHYRKLTELFNQAVLPASRKGCGFILELLRQHAAFKRHAPGIYGPA